MYVYLGYTNQLPKRMKFFYKCSVMGNSSTILLAGSIWTEVYRSNRQSGRGLSGSHYLVYEHKHWCFSMYTSLNYYNKTLE